MLLELIVKSKDILHSSILSPSIGIHASTHLRILSTLTVVLQRLYTIINNSVSLSRRIQVEYLIYILLLYQYILYTSDE